MMPDDSENPYVPPKEPTDSRPAATGSAPDRRYVPGGRLARAAIALFWSVAGLAALLAAFWSAVLAINLSEAEASWLVSIAPVMSVAQVVGAAAQVATIFAFCWWFYRAYANVQHAFHVAGLRYSPNWASGGFFIPFINFVVPYRVGREIWLGSQPGVQNVVDCRAPSPWIAIWWGFFLMMNASSIAASRLASIGYPVAHLLIVSNYAITAVAAVITIRMIAEVERLQQVRATSDAPAATSSPAAEHQDAEPLHRCPTCGAPYNPEDYSEHVPHIYCTSCKAELPRDEKPGVVTPGGAAA